MRCDRKIPIDPVFAPTLTPAGGDALIIVNVQRDFLAGGAFPVCGAEAVVGTLNRYADEFQRLKLPVVVARDWHPVNHISFREFGGPWPTHCVAGTPGAELAPSLRLPAGTRIISKGKLSESPGYSAFEGTHLAELLRRAGCHRVFIGGLATDFCVRATARDALREGFGVVVLEDATCPINLRPQDGAHVLAELRRHGACLAHLEAAA